MKIGHPTLGSCASVRANFNITNLRGNLNSRYTEKRREKGKVALKDSENGEILKAYG